MEIRRRAVMADEQHEWETVNTGGGVSVTKRMQVPGGWLYMHHDHCPDSSSTEVMARCFVPGLLEADGRVRRV
jgi:hypothetical protein